MLFQKVTDCHTSEGSVALLGIDPAAGLVLQYRPETHLWHSATGFWGTLILPQTGAREITIAELAPQEVGQIWPQIPRLDRRRYGAEAQRLESQLAAGHQVRTMAEMGLGTNDIGPHRPLATPGLTALLAARGAEWTTIARYGPETTPDAQRVARNRAQASRRHQEPLEAVLVDEAPGWKVLRVRHATVQHPGSPLVVGEGDAKDPADLRGVVQ